ncbi:MAG: sigma-70 family RNA polymerase sigma factor [Acidobacteriota bacterium]
MSTPQQPRTLSPDAIARLISGRQRFLAFLRKRVDSEEVAEDILQAAFVKSMERGGAIRDEETVVAWFYRMLRNAVIDHYRQKGSSEHAFNQLFQEMQSHQDPDVSFKGDICHCVTGLLGTLKPEYQQALETVDLHEHSLADLAKEAQITANNAAVRVHRAREALRKQVAATCGVCATHGCLDCTCKSKV